MSEKKPIKAVERPTGLALLREPFPAHQISKLPKPLKKDAPKGKCGECGGWHGLPAIHLDYVGHAALTDRLLDADEHWSWAPVADPASLGLPTAKDSMWISLTVCGVSRYGFGHADGKTGGDAVKEIIGDALRNAAMRFGAALDLWHKGQLHEEAPAEPDMPEGFENWIVDMEAKADDGLGELERAWKSSQPYLRKYLLDTDPDRWEAIKAKAAQSPQAASA